MFSRPKGWLPGLLSKPKNPHSLDHLKYLYNILCKNQTITEHNRSLLVETLRSISEILIWGDQNDSSVFDFFLEKNMLSFFLRYLRQKSGRYICVQLLQTLNILFENISNETSLYYLLSNNHINAIIVHKFDFSDEEVMAYYISFLKTLSLKLNKHTIHFFYNEHTNDFALYTEAIKFFNQSEPMVRIAVRTITLNVFKVDDKAMIKYIRNRTAAPYFSNLVWFIGNHILDLDNCVRNDADHQSRNRLSDLVAEHLDHLHYLNDILCINVDALNDVLTDQLLNRLLIPLYVYSLTMRKKYSDRQDKKHVGSVVSLFLLSQVFLIITYSPLVKQLAEIIFQGEVSLSKLEPTRQSPRLLRRVREFRAPEEPLEKTLDNNKLLHNFQLHGIDDMNAGVQEGNSTFYTRSRSASGTSGMDVSSPETEMAMSPTSVSGDTDISSPNQNSTDEEKIYSTLGRPQRLGVDSTPQQKQAAFSLDDRPYLEAIFNALECSENDYEALFALCLLYAMGHNDGIHQGLMDSVLMPTERSETKDHYNVALVERLIRIITLACQHGSKVRLATLELGIKLLKQLVYKPGKSFLQDRHLACIENAKECSTQLLRNFYKSEEIFLDMFEDEYREMIHRPLNVEYLTMDASILLPPTGTPLTGIHFNKRLPCGEVERARRAIRVFFLVRDLSLSLLNDEETQLPLTKEDTCVKERDILDLNNSDLIACTVITKERRQERRFLVIDSIQMILVEPDTKRLGWGVVRFVGFLQDVEVSGDKDDSRSLHITIHKPASSQIIRPVPLLSARFLFDDHIRCMAAKQRLSKGRIKARQQKMQMIERLLDIPADASGASQPGRSRPVPGRSHPVRVTNTTPDSSSSGKKQQSTTDQSGKSKSAKSGSTDTGKTDSCSSSKTDDTDDVEIAEEAFAYQSFNQHTGGASSSPAPVESTSQVQEIPLEDLSKKKKKHSARKIANARLSSMSSSGSHSRSHSHSPKRDEGIKSANRGRSTSLIVVTNKRDRSSTPKRREHSKSSPLPMTSSPAKSTETSDDSPDNYRSREKGSQSPKTLRPAEAPTLSLLPQGEDSQGLPTAGIDTLKLVQPAGVDRIRSLSDTSSTSSESQTDMSSMAKIRENLSMPDFAYKTGAGAEVEVNISSIDKSNVAMVTEKGASASDQLTKLAQIVQEHYKFSEAEQETSLNQTSSTGSE